MLASNATALLALARVELSDVRQPGLWSDDQLYTYMTEACDKVARRVLNLIKTYTWAYTANVATVALPPEVLHIRFVRDVATNRRIEPANANDLAFDTSDDYGLIVPSAAALFAGSGTVTSFVRDYEVQALRLVPIPQINGSIEAQCSVTIATPLREGFPLPFATAQDQRLVLMWMKRLAYLKHDAETEDLVRAKQYEADFENFVEERKTEERSIRRTPGVVRMEGW